TRFCPSRGSLSSKIAKEDEQITAVSLNVIKDRWVARAILLLRRQSRFCNSARRVTRLAPPSLDRTCGRRKHIVCVRADQSDRAHDKDKNHRQHHSVLGNVLAFLVTA